MAEFDTRQSLLIKIRDPQDSGAWNEFVDLYTPLIYRFSASRGVAPDDRPDVVQEIFKAVSRAIPRFDYDRDRATFRTWLYKVCRSKINNHLRTKMNRPIIDGSSTVVQQVENHPDPRDEHDWETQHRRHLLQWAAKKIRHEFADETWQAFWRTAVENHDIAQVSADLGMSPGAIYVARSRITARLRDKVASLEGIC